MPNYDIYEYFDVIHPLPSSVQRDFNDIPIVKKQNIDLSKLNDGLYITGIQNINKKDKFSKQKIVHCFKENSVLAPFYLHPLRNIEKLSRYYAVMTPDFSLHSQMDYANMYHAIYMNRYCGALWQSYGMLVINTIQWAETDLYDLYLSGSEKGSIFAISSLGIKNQKSKAIFIKGFNELVKRKSPSLIICIGSRIEEIKHNNLIYIPYNESFGNQINCDGNYQSKLFNDFCSGDDTDEF